MREEDSLAKQLEPVRHIKVRNGNGFFYGMNAVKLGFAAGLALIGVGIGSAKLFASQKDLDKVKSEVEVVIPEVAADHAELGDMKEQLRWTTDTLYKQSQAMRLDNVAPPPTPAPKPKPDPRPAPGVTPPQ